MEWPLPVTALRKRHQTDAAQRQSPRLLLPENDDEHAQAVREKKRGRERKEARTADVDTYSHLQWC